MRMGANDYLVKPCQRLDVLEAVDRAEAWRDALQRDRSARGLMQEALALARDRSRRVAQASAADPSQALQALTAALKACLPETLEHSQRVAKLAVRMGTILGLKGHLLDDLQHAALLHDVGKIAVADAVLDTERPLTAPELDILRTHVTLGFQIVSEVPALRHLAPIIVATNERFDGSGFPAGLAGEDIPLGARIIAVADAWDSLATARRMAGRLGADAVNAELVRGAGSDFDPDVIRTWLSVGEEGLCS
jgi:response regulator RpfG family c-di-GMP phosphodiesterase